MTEYRKGQRVKVEYEGVIVNLHAHDDCMEIKTDQEYFHYVYVSGFDTGAKVTLADPADWPPQVGDIWETGGTEYFAAEGWGVIALIPGKDGLHLDLAPFKRLNPVLVRRRGQ